MLKLCCSLSTGFNRHHHRDRRISVEPAAYKHTAVLAGSRSSRHQIASHFHASPVTDSVCYCYGAYALRPHSCLWCDFDAFQPGCHLSLALSFVALLLILIVACRCVFCLISAFYVHVRHPRSSLFQHVITSSVITLRPFALSLYSWRVLFPW